MKKTLKTKTVTHVRSGSKLVNKWKREFFSLWFIFYNDCVSVMYIYIGIWMFKSIYKHDGTEFILLLFYLHMFGV